MSEDNIDGWFGAWNVNSLSADPSVRRTGMWISNILEERRVEYTALPERPASLSRSVKSLVTGSKRKAQLMSTPVTRNCFEVAICVSSPQRQSFVEDPGFSTALERETSGWAWSSCSPCISISEEKVNSKRKLFFYHLTAFRICIYLFIELAILVFRLNFALIAVFWRRPKVTSNVISRMLSQRTSRKLLVAPNWFRNTFLGIPGTCKYEFRSRY